MVKAWEAETETRLPRDVEAVNPYELKVNGMQSFPMHMMS